jgi:quercetin dioxygenase-like cupin family protein
MIMVPSFDEYAEMMRAQGYEQVLVRAYSAGEIVETHRHPFAAKALVVSGEMWLTLRGETRHLVAGEGFELDAEEAHAERYGEKGATYWVGRHEVKRG